MKHPPFITSLSYSLSKRLFGMLLILMYVIMIVGIVPKNYAFAEHFKDSLPQIFISKGSTFYSKPDIIISAVTFQTISETDHQNKWVYVKEASVFYIAPGAVFHLDTMKIPSILKSKPALAKTRTVNQKALKPILKSPEPKVTSDKAWILPFLPQSNPPLTYIYKVVCTTVITEISKTNFKIKALYSFINFNYKFNCKAEICEKEQKKIQYLISYPFLRYNFSLPPPV